MCITGIRGSNVLRHNGQVTFVFMRCSYQMTYVNLKFHK
nr:MAG TPA: hypothetical protein [Caudoviricetes sp.]